MRHTSAYMVIGSVITLLACQKPKVAGGVDSITALDASTHSAFPIDPASHHPGTDCNACHGAFSSFTQFSCLNGCHAQPETNTNHLNLDGYSYDSNACVSCHPGGAADGNFAGHPFPISTADMHGDVRCAACHTTPGDRSQFSCVTGCHDATTTTPIHTGLSDYAYDSAKCLQCHPLGLADVAVNHTAFPVGDGSAHAGISCSQCHTDATQRANPAKLACGSCHLANDAALVSKHTTTASTKTSPREIATSDSRTCLRCHAESQIDVSAQHKHVTTSPCPDAGKPPHKGAGCTDCHSHYRSDKTYAADFDASPPPGCAECHENRQLCP